MTHGDNTRHEGLPQDKVRRRVRMRDYDHLPPLVRKALREANVSFSATWCRMQLKSGRHTPVSLARCIPLWDARVAASGAFAVYERGKRVA